MVTTPRSCEGRYRAVLKYYRRKRGTVMGNNYRFSEILEQAIPADDVLQPTKTKTAKKKIKVPRKRSVQQPAAAAGADAAAAAAAAATAAGADRAGEVVQLLRQLISDHRDLRAEVLQLRAQQEAWQAEMRSLLLQGLNVHHPTEVHHLDPLFPGDLDLSHFPPYV